jgi:membrane protein YqaA with SNARE-associated domain
VSALLILFGSAFVAATLLPLQSEAVLVALLVGGEHGAGLLIAVATAGNVLGSIVNWLLGRHLLRFRGRRWFPVSQPQLARAQDWYGRSGRWSLLASWLPVVGDPLTLVAGVMRERFVVFLALVTVAKAGRYGVLAMLTLAWI